MIKRHCGLTHDNKGFEIQDKSFFLCNDGIIIIRLHNLVWKVIRFNFSSYSARYNSKLLYEKYWGRNGLILETNQKLINVIDIVEWVI